MQCCPLSEADEYATVWNRKIRVARKDHVCCECRETIPRGAKYDYTSMLFDGSWSDWKTCVSCSEIGDHFTCGSRIVGQLWEELEDNFFPDMRAGGPCMEGLSPANKSRLFERRTAWLLAQED